MADTARQPADYQQRMAALDPTRSVCVTAPAGAGKTQLLSQRVLTLLARVEQPEQILAITFTRKAAAEMHHRIVNALLMASADEPQHEHDRLSWQLAKNALARDHQCGWQLLSNPSRLRIQTIDSLCASLTRQMPILANFGAQPAIADNADRLYRNAVQNLLSKLEGDSAIAEDLASLLAHLDNDMVKAERLLIALLRNRDQWLLHIGIGGQTDSARTILEQTLQQVIEQLLGDLHRQLLPFAPQLLPLLEYAANNLQRSGEQSAITELAGIAKLPGVGFDSVPCWLAIAQALLSNNHQWRKTVNKRTGFPTETQEGDKDQAKEFKKQFLQLLQELAVNSNLRLSFEQLRFLPCARYSDQQWLILESLTRLLPHLVAELTLIFQQFGEVDHSQMAIAALQALGDGFQPTELALKLDHHLSHILVDEFQDTASTQFRLLERLIEGWQEYNTEQPEQPNTMFIVGDGMQSIYGFREANVGLFLAARRYGINGLRLDDLPLTENFRSAPAVVNWVNSTFEQAFPSLENLSRGAVPFEHAHAFKSMDPKAGVEIFGFCGDKSPLDEAQKTVELVQQVMEQDPDASIGLLVRSRSHLSAILPALSKASISWNATDIYPLSNISVIVDLLSLTKALLNIADRISWAALLRTAWLGLDNRDIHILLSRSEQTEHGTHWPPICMLLAQSEQVAGLSRHARQRLPVVASILNSALQHRQRLTVRSWIEGVWMRLGGAACLNTMDEFAVIEDYFDLLEHYQQDGQFTAVTEFEQAVQGLYARPSEHHSVVQVMTIHKAKGLEFDTVILPGLSRAARSDDKSLLMWREHLPATGQSSSDEQQHASGLVISPFGATGDDEDDIYRHLRYEKKHSSELENTRLFYVATTRAVKRLYLLFEATQQKNSQDIKPPPSNSLLHSAWPAIETSVQWHYGIATGNGQLFLDFDVDNADQSLYRLPAGWQNPAWKFKNPLSQYYLDSDFGQDENLPDLETDQLARCVGTVVHQLLEQLACDGLARWIEMSTADKQRWLCALLDYAGVADGQRAEAISQITAAVDNTVNDEMGQWLLVGPHHNSHCEWPLLKCYSKGVKQRVIDRSFRASDGTYWIVDYKTSCPQDGETKADFIARESLNYRQQLSEYASLVSMLIQQQGQQATIKTALYFTFYPHLQELDHEQLPNS